jgi:hypothetical protein
MFRNGDIAVIIKPSENYLPDNWGVPGQVVRVVSNTEADGDNVIVPIKFLSPREGQIGSVEWYHKALRADRLRKI